MTYNALSTILFCATLTGCGGVLVQSPAPVSHEQVSPQVQAPRRAESVAGQTPTAKSELMFQVLTSLGIDYQNGGRSPKTGFDCSGLVAHVYQEAFGVRLPHNSQAQSKFGSRIARTELEPGDLVFYNTLNQPYSHVGIYLGEGRFVHAPKTGSQVRVERMENRYWIERFSGARRIPISL